MFKKIFLILVILALAVSSFGCGGKEAKLPKGTDVIVKIPQGTPTSVIAQMLEDKEIISSARKFSAEMRLKGLENSLQAGEYELKTGMDEKELIRKLTTGEVRYITVVIPEGFNVRQIAELLDEKDLIKKEDFLNAAKDYTPYEYMKTDNADIEYKSEGFLFPATYNILPGTSAESMLKILTEEFDNRLTEEWKGKLKEKDITIREFVTLSSLVEKEAAYDEDRKYIAKAFLERLKIHMPLQSCATIQYILGYAKPELTIADTRLPSPYNTYLHYGLPPGPIANPGMLAMQSVLEPSEETYLYFVVKKDGKHIFSKTYNEHLAAIERASQ